MCGGLNTLFVDVTYIVMNEEANEFENAYNNDPKVSAVIDQFNAECKLRRKLAEGLSLGIRESREIF